MIDKQHAIALMVLINDDSHADDVTQWAEEEFDNKFFADSDKQDYFAEFYQDKQQAIAKALEVLSSEK